MGEYQMDFAWTEQVYDPVWFDSHSDSVPCFSAVRKMYYAKDIITGKEVGTVYCKTLRELRRKTKK